MITKHIPKIDEHIKETGEWWRAWDDLVETIEELKTMDSEVAINELKKIFPAK